VNADVEKSVCAKAMSLSLQWKEVCTKMMLCMIGIIHLLQQHVQPFTWMKPKLPIYVPRGLDTNAFPPTEDNYRMYTKEHLRMVC
jgi:hypothetical protein